MKLSKFETAKKTKMEQNKSHLTESRLYRSIQTEFLSIGWICNSRKKEKNTEKRCRRRTYHVAEADRSWRPFSLCLLQQDHRVQPSCSRPFFLTLFLFLGLRSAVLRRLLILFFFFFVNPSDLLLLGLMGFISDERKTFDK